MKRKSKLLCLIMAVLMLVTMLSGVLSAVAEGTTDSVKQAIEGYKGNGYIYDSASKKNVGDPAFKTIADDYKLLTESQKSSLGMGNLVKVAYCANGYMGKEVTYPSDVTTALAKDKYLSGQIDDLIGYIQPQKDAIGLMQYISSSPQSFVPQGQTLSVSMKNVKFVADSATTQAQVDANVAGLKELLNKYTALSTDARMWIDRVSYTNYGSVMSSSSLNTKYDGTGKLFKIVVAYETTKSAPFTETFTQVKPEAPASEHIKQVREQIAELTQTEKDAYAANELRDNDNYRLLGQLKTELDVYSSGEALEMMNTPEYAAYLASLADYYKAEAAFYQRRSMATTAPAYERALASMKFSSDYQNMMKHQDKLIAAALQYEQDLDLAKLLAAGKEFSAISSSDKGLLTALGSADGTYFYASAYSSALYINAQVKQAGTLPLTGIWIANSLGYAEDTFISFCDKVRNAEFPLTKEQAAGIYNDYMNLGGWFNYLPFDCVARMDIVVSFLVAKTNYPARSDAKPDNEVAAYKKTNVAYDLGFTKERIGETVGALNGTVGDLLATSGISKDSLYAGIFTNANLTSIVSMLMKMLEEMAPTLGIGAGIVYEKVNPQNLAKVLPETAYAQATEKMAALGSSWINASADALQAYLDCSYGFEDGDADAFVSALAAHLRDFYALLEGGAVNMHLQNYVDDNGALQFGLYEKVFVELFEILGIPNFLNSREYSSRILAENEVTGSAVGSSYLNGKTEGMLLSAIEPLLDMVDGILAMPIDELFSRLPDLLYYLDNGTLADTLGYAVDNLGALGGIVDEATRTMIKSLGTNTVYTLLNDFLSQGIDLSGILGEGAGVLKLNLSKDGFEKLVADLIGCGTAEVAESRSMEDAYRFHIAVNDGDRADMLMVIFNYAMDELRANVKTWEQSGEPMNQVQTLLSGVMGLGDEAVATLLFKMVLPDADYSAVDALVRKVPADLSIYTKESAAVVTEAKAAVVYELSELHQTEVDAMAETLSTAIDALVLKEIPTDPTNPSDPTDPAKPTEPDSDGGTTGGTVTAPSTGDSVMAILVMVAVAGAGVLVTLRKKEQD